MWTKKGIIQFMGLGIMVLSLVLGAGGLKNILAEAEDEDDYQPSKEAEELLTALPLSKHALAEGIRQATQGTAAVISAKFEMDDRKLSLSVYTAEQGLSQDAEHNVFKEIAGSSEAETWTPQTEIIKEGEDLEYAQEQLKVLSASKFSLLDFIAKAEKDQPGTILSITPEVEGGKNVCEVRVLSQGKVIEIHYDVITGEIANEE